MDMRKRFAAVAAGVVVVVGLSACSQVQQATDGAAQAQEVAQGCTDAGAIALDLKDFAQKALHSGSIGFENAGAFIDAAAAMDTAKVDTLGKEVGAGLPPADAKAFRETLDRYGAAVKQCRLAVEKER